MQYQGRVYHIQLPGPDQETIQKHWQHWVHNTQDDCKQNKNTTQNTNTMSNTDPIKTKCQSKEHFNTYLTLKSVYFLFLK
jgi:hypothetical protein